MTTFNPFDPFDDEEYIPFPQSASLNGQTYENLYCRACGDVSHSVITRPMTASERRAANRERIAQNWNVTGYDLYAVAEDAWTRRTLNLDALISAGRI